MLKLDHGDAFLPQGLPLLIGSLPVADGREALELIWAHTPEIPLWPQLPSTPKGGMLNQFLEGIPGIVEEAERTYFAADDQEFEAAMLTFYEEYFTVSEDSALLLSSRFQVSEERAPGIGQLLAALQGQPPAGIQAIKGQITGPFTLLTSLADRDHRLAYYHPIFRELAVKALAMKAAWQATLFNPYAPQRIVFIDEPALAGLGSSAFISIGLDEIAADLGEVIGAINGAGAMAGIHVCANTDWSFLLNLELDILSFDAYGFFDRLIACKQELLAFLARGGMIAWGLVPTSDEAVLLAETTSSLVALWERQATLLADGDWDLPALLKRTFITPSCGTGALTLGAARHVLTLTKEVSAALRSKYGK